METTRARWTAGDRVIVRATTCTVTRAERFADCEGLRLATHSPPEIPFGTLLVPYDRPRPIELSRRPHAIRPQRWLHTVRRVAARHHPFGGLRCTARARIELLPYQLEPALAMQRHASLRILLADAVGLGKTIQAGLVLAEVLEHNSSRRALVLMPAGLRFQWQSELASHFDIAADVCDATWLRHRGRDLSPDANPWALPGTYLASLDFIKRPEVLNSIEALLWDIVIIDEAHVVTSGTDRRVAVDAIAARARRVLLLTGTPHSGDDTQFEALCRLGEGPARTPLVMFRRRRHEVQGGLPRRSLLLSVRLSETERHMHQLLERYTSEVWRASHARADRLARLVSIVLRKRALSSAGSLAASLARRIDLLSVPNGVGEQQLALPLRDREDDVDDFVRDDVLGAPGLLDPVRERRWLGTLLAAARQAARQEGKTARLCRLLARVAEPAIVFTEYRDTLARLQRALGKQLLPVLTLHGGMSGADRHRMQHAFNERPSLLLATDAAAEGLNLQRRCRLVIHYELPWNPLRLEQRTGRVDRIGQSRRVHEIALVADDTAERIVLAPLARRAGRAKDLATSGGRMLELLSESRVAEAVMAGRPDLLADVPEVRVTCTEPELAAEAAREASRLADQRRWRLSERPSRTDLGPVVTSIRAQGLVDERIVTVVYTVALVTSDAQVVHSEPLVINLLLADQLRSARSAPATIDAVQRAVARAHGRIEIVAAERLQRIAGEVIPMHRALLRALRARETAIARFRSSTARELVQAGLFDRRALRDAEQHHAANERRSEEAEEVLKALASAKSVTQSVRLEAALIRNRGMRRSILHSPTADGCG